MKGLGKIFLFTFLIALEGKCQHLMYANLEKPSTKSEITSFSESKLEYSLNIFIKNNSMNEEKSKLFNNGLEKFCTYLSQKRKNKGKNFLKYVFYKTHKEFLKSYQLNSTLAQTLETGRYDCVSGTALYSIILDKLGINHSIKETKFHVYLLANYNGSYNLLESTDGYEGFITDEATIVSREEQYKNQEQQSEKIYSYKEKMYQTINIHQLAGLELYNKGIVEYNKKNYLKALSLFERALKLYESPRIQDIFKMSLDALSHEIEYSKSSGLAQSYLYYSNLKYN